MTRATSDRGGAWHGRHADAVRFVALISCLFTLSCGQAETRDSAPSAPVEDASAAPAAFTHTSKLVEVPVDEDLTDVADAVWMDREFGVLRIHPDEQRRFTGGWYRVQSPSPAPGAAPTKGSIESAGRAAAVELPIARVVDRTLVLELETFEADKVLPDQTLRVAWNGNDLGRHRVGLGAAKLEIAVPAGVQRLGLNRLRLEPLYWVSGADAGVSSDRRPVGFTLTGLRLDGGSRGLSGRPPGVQLRGGSIVQAPASVLVWHRALPGAPRWQGRLRWRPSVPRNLGVAPASAPRVGSIHLIATTDRDETTTLAEIPLADLASADGRAIDLDLGELAGEFVALSAVVTPDSPGFVIWSGPRLTGTRARRVVDANDVRSPYDVLVILFDTLRADHLAPYGNDVVSTPHVAELAASGFTFREADANASWTKPSVASMWTGLHPWAHRVTRTDVSVPETAPYLPAILSDAGWKTMAISANAHFSGSFGFARGFDAFHEFFHERKAIIERDPSPEALAAHVWDVYIEPALASAGDAPFFGLVHEIDPHAPYDAPAPYDALYDFGYEGNVDGWDEDDHRQALRILEIRNNDHMWLGEADRRAVHAEYMAEVSFVDAYIGALLARLEASGRRDRTLVVLLSDHGEQFFEHGGWGHGNSLYQEEVEVPLVFSLPGVIPAGASASTPVQLVDLSPTVLDLVGLETPAAMQGRSLLPDLLAGADERATPRGQFSLSASIMLEKGRPSAKRRSWEAARLGRWKLHRRTHRSRGRATIDYQLYDLERDPEEVLDLWAHEPVVGHAMKELLAAKLARDARVELEAPTVDEIDAEVRANLRGLGYVE